MEEGESDYINSFDSLVLLFYSGFLGVYHNWFLVH